MVCLNLVKASEKRPRETLLRTEFQNAIQYLNQGVGGAPIRQAALCGAQLELINSTHVISLASPLPSIASSQVPEAEQIRYVPFDIGYHSKQSPEHVLTMLTPILEMCLEGTGFFVSGIHAADTVCAVDAHTALPFRSLTNMRPSTNRYSAVGCR